jgi:hypothetical protein
MLKRITSLGCAALLLAALSSCIFDPAPKGDGPPPPSKYRLIEPRVNKSDVLNNIEFAYNKKQIDPYDRLLDDNFNFFYTDTDGGNSTPVQWGRDVEKPATQKVFENATTVDLTLDYHDGVTWSQQISGSETWYYTTVFYHFTIKIGDTTFIPNAGAKAQFTVRNAGTAENPDWKLVEFRDLGGPS